MLVIVVLFAALAFGPQVVLSSHKFKLSLTTDIEQCGPVSVTFNGDILPAIGLPLTLTIIPFNSSPISIPIPSTVITGTSQTVWVTYLPLEEGFTFVASLDDASGATYGSISDIVRILPSSTANSSCLPSITNPTSRRFSVDGPVSQCQSFNVTYDTTLVNNPPSIRIFTPRHSAFAINETDAPASGVETYLMSAARQTEVILLFDDGLGYREVSDLLAVGGDTSSDDSCIITKKENSTLKQTDGTGSMSQGKLPKGTIIGISLTVGIVVGGVAIFMMQYITRERRRRRIQFENLVNTRMIKPSSGNMASTFTGGFVSRPPYAWEKSPSATVSDFIHWTGDVTESQSYMDSRSESILQNSGRVREGSVRSEGLIMNQRSLSSLDIEHIIDMATIYSGSPLRSPPISRTHSLLTVPPVRTVFPRHLRDPSDVPTDSFPNQSMSMLFPDHISRDSNGSFPAGQRLTVATQSGSLPYSSVGWSGAEDGFAASLPVNAAFPTWVSERVSSFPVSVTSLSPSRQS